MILHPTDKSTPVKNNVVCYSLKNCLQLQKFRNKCLSLEGRLKYIKVCQEKWILGNYKKKRNWQNSLFENNVKNLKIRDFSGGPVVKTLHFHYRVGVRSLVRELSSHMLHGVAKKEKNKMLTRIYVYPFFLLLTLYSICLIICMLYVTIFDFFSWTIYTQIIYIMAPYPKTFFRIHFVRIGYSLT